MISRAPNQTGTYADLEAAPAGVVAELVDGALMLGPRPPTRHTIVATGVASALHTSFGGPSERGPDRPGGWWIMLEPECHLEVDVRVVVPDVAGWRRTRMPSPALDTHKITIAPDWVCEVLSPSTRGWDSVVKMGAYRAAGVAWAWLVEPGDERVEVYRNDGDVWTQVAAEEGAQVLRLPPFEAVAIDLGDWWARV